MLNSDELSTLPGPALGSVGVESDSKGSQRKRSQGFQGRRSLHGCTERLWRQPYISRAQICRLVPQVTSFKEVWPVTLAGGGKSPCFLQSWQGVTNENMNVAGLGKCLLLSECPGSRDCF